MYEIVFRVKKDGAIVHERFDSPFLCKRKVNKLKHSKKCELISYPFLD